VTGEPRLPHPYVRRHIAAHAAAGGVLNDSVLNLETLPYLDEARLSTLLGLAEAEPLSEQWLLRSAWRSVRSRWSWDDPDANAAALDLAYRAAGGWRRPQRWTATGLRWEASWAQWPVDGAIAAPDAKEPMQVALGTVDGAPLLVALESWQLTFWDPATGEPVGGPIPVGEGRLRAIALAAGAGLVVAAGLPAEILVWDAVTHLPRPSIPLPFGDMSCLDVGQLEGRPVAAVAPLGGAVRVYLLDNGELLWTFEGDHRKIALVGTADGRLYLATVSGANVVDVWDVLTGAPVGSPAALAGEVSAVALGEVGERLVVLAGFADGGVRVWDAWTEEDLPESAGHAGGAVRDIALARVGTTYLAATGGTDETAHVWYLAGGEPTSPPLPHPGSVFGVAFAEIEGRPMLATLCEDGNARLWDPLPAPGATVAGEGWFPSVALDGPFLAAATQDGRARLWKTSGDVIADLVLGEDADGSVRRAGWGRVWLGQARGRPVLVTELDSLVEVWDLDDPFHPAVVARSEITDASLVGVHPSAERVLMVTASWRIGGPLTVLDPVSGEVVRETPLQRRVLVKGHGNGLLALGTDDGVRVEDLLSGEPMAAGLEISELGPAAVAEVEGRLLLAVADATRLRGFDLRSGRPSMPAVPISRGTRDIRWGRAGNRDVLLTQHDATICVWHPHTGRKLSELPFGTRVGSVAVQDTGAGSVMVAVSGPGVAVVELFDTSPPSPSAALPELPSADGAPIVSASELPAR
jgi:WD40 repeat protein